MEEHALIRQKEAIAELEANGWDVNAAFEIPEVQAAMTGEEISTAGGNLDAYCGL